MQILIAVIGSVIAYMLIKSNNAVAMNKDGPPINDASLKPYENTGKVEAKYEPVLVPSKAKPTANVSPEVKAQFAVVGATLADQQTKLEATRATAAKQQAKQPPVKVVYY